MTKAQESAVKHHKGACLVLAGPGSGKTFVITNRLVHMVKELRIPGEHILVITFTKAAALEMEARFKKLLPDAQPWFGTFHSCFYYILRNSFTSIPSRFISTEEKHRILREICDEVLGKDFEIEFEEVERLLSLYMNNGLSMQKIPEYADLTPKHLRQLYGGFHKALAEYGYMDFDDLMLCCYQVLKENPELRKRWQEQFQYILIDECQDMNVLQYEIVKLLGGAEKNIFMVGDDDQSVYRFRGARVELMQRFIEEYKPVSQIHLDKNFRSTAEIVESSLKVIEQNKNRFAKCITAGKSNDIAGTADPGKNNAIKRNYVLNTDSTTLAYSTQRKEESGVHIKGFELRRDMYEAVFEQLQKGDIPSLHNTAIIYRTNRELRNMAYKLRRKGIAYVSKEDRKSIFDEDWYLDIEAYIRLGLGSRERQYILRVANKPNRFIKREELINVTRLPESLECAVKHISSMRPYLAVKYIWSGIGYGRWLERNLGTDIESFDAVTEQFEEIQQEMKGFRSLEEWLIHVEADRTKQKENLKENQQTKEQAQQNGVQLLTMHASKGLEFDTVYLLDVNKGKIPKGSRFSNEELEEERRLFYVAMTRAKNHLNIYYVKGGKDHVLQPSVFLEPIL